MKRKCAAAFWSSGRCAELLKKYEDLYPQQEKTKNADGSNKCGIYCMKVNGHIVYIGKAGDAGFYHRWISHIANTFEPEFADHYYMSMYTVLRSAIQTYHQSIEFDILEEVCAVDGKVDARHLKEREDYWIMKYLPPLNTQTPIGEKRAQPIIQFYDKSKF